MRKPNVKAIPQEPTKDSLLRKIPQREWTLFMRRCKTLGMPASAGLRQLIRRVAEGKIELE